MDDFELYLAILVQILAGVGLAAAAGLRAFIPPLAVGLLGRFEVLELRPSLDWMESTPALVIFGSAVVLEILGDKIPWLDHTLDTIQGFLKPAAGILVASAALVDLPPLWAAILAILLGGTVAGSVHVAKAGVRLASTGTTGGLVNPVLSVAEDGLALGGTLMAVFFPVLAFIILVIGTVLLIRGFSRWRSSRPPAGAVGP